MTSQDWVRLLRSMPSSPDKVTTTYEQNVSARISRRVASLRDRVGNVSSGRTVPVIDDITIGSGRQLQLAILFLDVCGFSNLDNWTLEEQKNVLALMNVFMAEMLNVVRDYDGTFEKNTGDGLMAYFGEGASSTASRVKPAVECAVTMHHINDRYISPQLRTLGLPTLGFRIGIEVGPVTLAKVGIPGGTHNSVVAIGTPANVACKLMRLIPNGGICIGDFVQRELPNNWTSNCARIDASSCFVYKGTGVPYQAWTLDYRIPVSVLPQPSFGNDSESYWRPLAGIF